MIKIVEQRLQNPAPGSAIEAAKKFGIDLTLLVEQLRLTPNQRVRKLQQSMYMVSKIQYASRTKRNKDAGE